MGNNMCYALMAVPPAVEVPNELQASALLAWSDRLLGQGSCQAAVGLILKLDSMGRLGLDPRHRLLLLRLLEDPLHSVLGGLSRPAKGLVRAGEGRGFDLSMEERLTCAFFRNLKQALFDLDRDPVSPDADLTEARVWALEQQLRLLQRQIESAIAACREPPAETWLELHGCFAYYHERIHPSLDKDDSASYAGDFEAEMAYKRVLLLGLAAGRNAELVCTPTFGPRLQHLGRGGAPGVRIGSWRSSGSLGGR